jgi:hypothetical protein
MWPGKDREDIFLEFQEMKMFFVTGVYTQNDLPSRVGSFGYIEHQQGDNIEVMFVIIIYPFH